MKSQALQQFLDAVAADPALQEHCCKLRDVAELIQLAEQAGFGISTREVQLWAHDEAFGAPWWPWAGSDRAERVAFFRGESRPRRQGRAGQGRHDPYRCDS